MEAQSTVQIPRVAIRFCTQCKWNLRAAYYAQELLQTFSTTLGEVSLIPVTGGIFTVTLYHQQERHQQQQQDDVASQSDTQEEIYTPTTTTASSSSILQFPSTPTSTLTSGPQIQETLIWDRKRDSGFPETKELKNRIRNIIDPDRDMGHIDRSLKKSQMQGKQQSPPPPTPDQQGNDSRSESKTPSQQQQQLQSPPPQNPPLAGGVVKDAQVTNTEEPQVAAGGENLDFGNNLEAKAVETTKRTPKEDCEDCN